MRPVLALLGLAFLLGLVPAAGHAQAPLQLTLRGAIERAQANSPSARIAQLRFEESRFLHRAFQARFLPAIFFTGSGPGLLRSINNVEQDDGSVRYVPQSRTFSSAGLALTQELPLTGGRLSVRSGLSRIDQFGALSWNQWRASPLVLEMEQPLFQFNALKWDRRLEPLRYRAAQQAYAEEYADIAVDITDLFFAVFIAQMNVDRATFNVAVNDTIYTLSKGRYELGKIAENDLLQSELALLNAQTELSEARIAYDRALQDLRIALDLSYDAAVEIVPPLEAPLVEVDPQLAVAQARQNRSDFTNLALGGLQAEREVARTHSANGFSADLVASYGLNQSAGSLSGVYADPLDQQAFSIGFRVPLYQWGRGRAEFEAALAEQERTVQSIELQRKELDQDVYFEALQFRQLQQQVRLAAKADTIAARRFEVARNRYTIGKIDITDLFDAQQAKDSASQAYVRTLHQYWTSYFRLRRLTLYDFTRREPLVPQP